MIMPFILGIKGNEWAWEKRTWTDVHEFRRFQKRWAIAGFVIIGLLLFVFITTEIFT